jgi:hypothetical protein
MNAMSRRGFLMSATAIGGAALLLLAARRAFALSFEEADAQAAKLYAGHCSANNAYHAELVADLTAKLHGHSQTEIESALAAARCPICGCPIA